MAGKSHFFHCYTIEALINVNKLRDQFEDIKHDKDGVNGEYEERRRKSFTNQGYRAILEETLTKFSKTPDTLKKFERITIRKHLMGAYENDPNFQKICLDTGKILNKN